MDETEMEARARALVDDRLFDAYWDAVKHFGTTDLVLTFDTEEDVDPVCAFKRTKFLEGPDAPPDLRAKFSKPARDAAVNLKSASTAFWLYVFFPEGGVVTAVVAERIGAGGSA